MNFAVVGLMLFFFHLFTLNTYFVNGCDVHKSIADMLFLFDTLETVNDTKTMTTFISEIIRSVTVHPDNIRVGVGSYTDDFNSYVQLISRNESSSIYTAIDKIKIKYHDDAENNEALKDVRRHEFRNRFRNYTRPGIIVMISSSGHPDLRRSRMIAKALLRVGVKIISIGVGVTNRNYRYELNVLASGKDHLFMVDTFDDLHGIADQVLSVICADAAGNRANVVNHPDVQSKLVLAVCLFVKFVLFNKVFY